MPRRVDDDDLSLQRLDHSGALRTWRGPVPQRQGPTAAQVYRIGGEGAVGGLIAMYAAAAADGVTRDERGNLQRA